MQTQASRWLAVGWLAVAAALAWCAPAKATVWKTFLLGGQSNMTGNGLNSELPAALQAPLPQVQIFYGHQAVNGWGWAEGNWSDLQPGFSKDPARFGPEVTFGRAMAQRWPDTPIALVKYAKSSGLAADWQTTAPNNTQWNYFWQTVANATAQLPPGDSMQFVGMLWMQGEGDTSQAAALAYEQNLTQFIADVRAQTGVSDLPFIIGQIAAAPWGAWATTVQQAQANVAAEVPGCALVVTDDLSRWANDRYHYDTAGIMTLGERFAVEYTATVPEPGVAVAVAALLGLIYTRRRRRERAPSRSGITDPKFPPTPGRRPG